MSCGTLTGQRRGAVFLRGYRSLLPSSDDGAGVLWMIDVKPGRRRSRIRLGELLVRSGCIDRDELAVALELQGERPEQSLGSVLVGLGLTTERAVTQALSRQLNVPAVDLDA